MYWFSLLAPRSCVEVLQYFENSHNACSTSLQFIVKGGGMLSEENFLSACFVITVSFFMRENCSLKLHWNIYINPLQAPGPSSAQSSKELTVIMLASVRSQRICYPTNGHTLGMLLITTKQSSMTEQLLSWSQRFRIFLHRLHALTCHSLLQHEFLHSSALVKGTNLR